MKQLLFAALGLMTFSSEALAQQSALTRTELQRHDLSAPGQEAVQIRVDFPAGSAAPPHTHPGEEIVYVLSGTLVYQLANDPPITLHAGEVLFIPRNVVHSARNIDTVAASELATYVVDKGRPLSAPALR